MGKRTKIIILILIGFLAVQFFSPSDLAYSTPVKDLTNVPKEVSAVIRNACFNCHSNEVKLSWYDKITPVNFLVNQHIQDGRNALNFSNWDDLEKGKQNATLFYSLNKILAGEMPLKSYTMVHSDAIVTNEQISIIKNYLDKVAAQNNLKVEEIGTQENVAAPLSELVETAKFKNVEKALNGISYIPDYKNWKAMSFSDRFDNGTMRIIYGNKVAEEAVRTGNTNPWPDGTIFAKTAWKQKLNADGILSPGAFVQVEYMIKDAEKYKDTKGWGWARWKGNDLKPYGATKDFAQECVTCHIPAKDNDHVFTAPLHLNFNPKKDTKTTKK